MDGLMTVRAVFIFFLFLHCWVTEVSADSDIIIWDEVYPEVRYRNFNYPKKMDAELLRLLYDVVREAGGRLVVHSDYRQKNKKNNKNIIGSWHHVGKAVDFRLDDYTHLLREERLYVYYQKTQLIEDLLQAHEMHDKIGLGIYPYSVNPFWHIDTRGMKARWCRNEKKIYVGYEHCKKRVKESIKSFKATLRILQSHLWEFGKDSEIQPWETPSSSPHPEFYSPDRYRERW